MNIDDLKKQLINKKRTVEELANVISLRTDQNPNYSILLGAGCSVSSGIRSANELINEWRNGYSNHIEAKNIEEQKAFLKKEHPDWYDPNKEYSSLFEKKFDLQRHRRMFVETEVCGKTPSIGYAYLTSLIKSNYFHTLFTTNFDDLINEAFYLYSDLRPIVCAHDSSINSITITSRRPKIIKLHGDYLFDDIKATVRETETLEHNMKAKFTEFAKDYGLIVVGYSGYDRSIMEAIAMLLKNDTYFNNGIYWCLRKDSEISEELKKLFWKDKVYFVEIEGFDELFAQIHTNFNKENNIPISTSSISRRPSEVIQRLLSSENFRNSSSPILRKAYAQLERESKRTMLMDLILPRDKDEANDGKESLSDDELISRVEIQKLVSTGAFREAIAKGKKAIQSIIKPSLKREILLSLVEAHRALGELNEAISIIDELISDQPFLASNHLLKADILFVYQDKLGSINKAIGINPYWYKPHHKKALLSLELAAESYGVDRENAVKEANKALEEGLKRDPSLENPCWDTKFRLISLYVNDRANKVKQQNEIIDNLKEMNPESPLVLRLEMSILTAGDNQSEINLLIANIDELKRRTPSKIHPVLDEIKLKGIAKTGDLEKISREIAEVQKVNDLTTRHPDLVVGIANVMREQLGDDSAAIKILKESYQHADFDRAVVSALINVLLDTENLIEAENIFTKTSKQMSSGLKYQLKLRLLEEQEDYANALNELKKREKITGYKDTTEFYLLIKNKDYLTAKNRSKEYLNRISFSLEAKSEIVNYELACKKLNEKINVDRLNNLMNFDSSSSDKAAIYAILGKKNEMIDNLKKAIVSDKSCRFLFKRWPVFDDYKSDSDFIKAVEY